MKNSSATMEAYVDTPTSGEVPYWSVENDKPARVASPLLLRSQISLLQVSHQSTSLQPHQKHLLYLAAYSMMY
jgi:hypothetical protein